jgi:hypothetical protein
MLARHRASTLPPVLLGCLTMRCAACRRRTPARALPSTRDHDLGRSRCRDLRAPGWTLQGYVLAVKQRRGAVTPATPEEVALGPLGPRASAEAAAARTSRSGAPGGRCRPASTSARRGESPSSPAEAKDDGIALPHRHDGALRRRNRGVAAPRSLGRSRGSRCRSPAAPCLESSPAPAISRSACRARPRPKPRTVRAGLPSTIVSHFNPLRRPSSTRVFIYSLSTAA